jgi:hypothetical protein
MHRILKYRVQVLLQLIILSFLIMLIGGCTRAIPTTPDDFVPRSISSAINGQRIEGSVNVQARIPGVAIHSDVDIDLIRKNIFLHFFDHLDETKLKIALEKTIAQNGIFSEINQGNADYVLDVWIESIRLNSGFHGNGYIVDMFSIWRFTRTKDGKVLVCDFVNSHDDSRSFSLWPQLNVATREIIQKGLTILLDKSEGHLSAMSKASHRHSMGPIVPEGYTEWVDHVIQNWSKLKMGLTIDEVENLIGSIRANNEQYKKDATERYITDIYTLIFISGQLSRWELKDSSVKNKATDLPPKKWTEHPH